jgi:hypothetical protein
MKNEKSDTPETDAMHAMRLIEFRGEISQYFEMVTLSRKLERERNEWKSALLRIHPTGRGTPSEMADDIVQSMDDARKAIGFKQENKP